MAFTCETEGYYKKMLELQEKLRRSEEQRFKLEEKFNESMRMTRDAEHERLRILRHKYHRFLEQDKIRQERNENILRSLDRVENRARMLAAKTERFKALRKQYESQIRRLNTTKSPTHSEYPTPKIPQEQSQYEQTYASPRKKLFADVPASDNPEAKLAMLEQFMRDNFQNFPKDLNKKTKENVLNDNRIFNGQYDQPSTPLSRFNNSNDYENKINDQRYIETGPFETIDSDSKESQEYDNNIGKMSQQKVFDTYKETMRGKLKNKISPVSPSKKSLLLGNAIEKELEKLHNKDLKQPRPNDETCSKDEKANEVDPYVKNYKDIVSKSEEKFGIKHSKVNVSPKENFYQQENTSALSDYTDIIPKTRDENINNDKLETITRLPEVPPKRDINEEITDNPNKSFQEPKAIESDNENPIIKKYKEVAKIPIDADITYTTSNRTAVESKVKPMKENESVNRQTYQYKEVPCKNDKYESNTNIEDNTYNANEEKRASISSEIHQNKGEEYGKGTYAPNDQLEGYSIQNVNYQSQGYTPKSDIPAEQEYDEDQINNQPNFVPQDLIEEGESNIPEYGSHEQYNEENVYQNDYNEAQYREEKPESRKISIIQQDIDGKRIEEQHHQQQKPEYSNTESEMKAKPIEKQSMLPDQSETRHADVTPEQVDEEPSRGKLENQSELEKEKADDTQQKNVVEELKYEEVVDQTKNSSPKKVEQQIIDTDNYSNEDQQIPKENVSHTKQQNVEELTILEDYNNQQEGFKEQLDVTEQIDQNYMPQQEHFEDQDNYEIYDGQHQPAEHGEGTVYQEEYNENFPIEQPTGEQSIYPEQIDGQIDGQTYEPQQQYIESDYQPGYENQQYETMEQYPEQQEYQTQGQYQEGYPTETYPIDQQYQQEFPEQNYQEYAPQAGEYSQEQYPENFNPDQHVNPEDVQYSQEHYPDGYDPNMYQSEQEYVQGEQNIDIQYENEQSQNVQDYQSDYPQEYQGFSDQSQPYQQTQQDASIEQQEPLMQPQETPMQPQESVIKLQESITEQQVTEQTTGNVEVNKENNETLEASTSESTIKSENQKTLEGDVKPLLEKKLPNLAEMLDTDTESIKQETKISNDSDFDFSHG